MPVVARTCDEKALQSGQKPDSCRPIIGGDKAGCLPAPAFQVDSRSGKVTREGDPVPFGPDTSDLEAELAKIKSCLQASEADAALSRPARDLRRTYYTHRRDELWPHLVRLTLERKVLSYEQELQQKQKCLDSVSGSTEAEKMRAATAFAQAKNALREARAEFDAKSSVLLDVHGESWEVITAHELLPAVANVRGDFEKLERDLHSSTEGHCFKQLHPVGAGQSEPAIFKQHFWYCVGKFNGVVLWVFGRFLAISLAQNGSIGQAPVEWAALQVRDLIDRSGRLVNNWVKSVCDKPDYDLKSLDRKTPEELFFRTDWRAPKWIRMQPHGNAPYDASTAWERMNEDETKKTLKYLREDRWILSLERTLEEVVGSAHETLSKRTDRPAPGSQQAPPESFPPAATTSNRKAREDSKRLILKYRSGPKRAILAALIRNPKATNAEICRALDADGGEELPATWKSRSADRLFFDAYSNSRTRHKVENVISKVRRDLRDRRLLD